MQLLYMVICVEDAIRRGWECVAAVKKGSIYKHNVRDMDRVFVCAPFAKVHNFLIFQLITKPPGTHNTHTPLHILLLLSFTPSIPLISLIVP